MYYFDFKNSFFKDLKKLEKQDRIRFQQVKNFIKLVVENPFSYHLDKKKLRGYKKPTYRYYVGMDFRILIQIDKNCIWFLRVGKRENFY